MRSCGNRKGFITQIARCLELSVGDQPGLQLSSARCSGCGLRGFVAIPQPDHESDTDVWRDSNAKEWKGVEQPTQLNRKRSEAQVTGQRKSSSAHRWALSKQALQSSGQMGGAQRVTESSGPRQAHQGGHSQRAPAPARLQQTLGDSGRQRLSGPEQRNRHQLDYSGEASTSGRVPVPPRAGGIHRWLPTATSSPSSPKTKSCTRCRSSMPSQTLGTICAKCQASLHIGLSSRQPPDNRQQPNSRHAPQAVPQRQGDNQSRVSHELCRHHLLQHECPTCTASDSLNRMRQTGSHQQAPQPQRDRLQAQQAQRPQQSARKKPEPKARPKSKPIITEIQLPDDVTVSQLAELLKAPLPEVESNLTELGETPGSAEDLVAPSNAELVAMAFGKAVLFSNAVQNRNSDAVSRPPVVTIMGHVDHGKTTLLDALRKTAVAAGEAGGITQHIGAFQVQMPDSGGIITFLDTPGHAAFTAMRARGAAVTDVVVLVVATDDGIMPQTREALHHAQAAGCPIVVALTKCDVPGANPQRARQQLMAEGLELEEFGGNIQVVETAAPVGLGLQQLEEALLFQAELMDLKASQTRPAVGVVVEARMDKGQGAVATVIVKRGTLKVGQPVVLGSQWGKVRAMKEASGKSLKEALPGQPVEVSGLRGMPMAGDDFMVQASEEGARRLSEARQLRKERIWIETTEANRSATSSASTSEAEGEAKAESAEERQLVVLVKADTQGSAEAVAASMEALSSQAVTVKAVQAGLGPVSTSDIDVAVSMGAHIVAFNVKNSVAAVDSQAKQKSVPVLRHNIIYHLLQEVSRWMAALAPQVEEEVVLGEAAILQTFPVKEKRGQESTLVAGCRVHTGSMAAAERFRVLRSGDTVWEGTCSSLKRHKLDVQQVGKGTECGILLEGYSGFQPGDVLHCITTQLRPQLIEDVVNLTSSGKRQAAAGT